MSLHHEISDERHEIDAVGFDAKRRMICRIVREIQQYGIQVNLRFPVSVDEDLGRISGSIIEVVTDPVEPTITAFTLCHLFGHMIQFTNMEKYRHLIEPVSRKPPVFLSEEFWQKFYVYEREAFAYGLCLLENAISPDGHLLNQYSNFMDLDFGHFREYITSGKRLNRIEYRTKLLYCYASHPAIIPLKPLPIDGVDWSNSTNIEALIY